jgi:hypothetical protein
LSLAAVDERSWQAQLVWSGADLFLNAALGRPLGDRFFLYELEGGRGRVAWQSPSGGQTARVVEYGPNRVVVEAESSAGGTLILTDLAFPGWEAAVDGSPGVPRTIEKMLRGVELSAGKRSVIWNYRPASLYWGAGISISTLMILLALGHVRYWYPRLLEWPAKRPMVNQ